MEINGNKIGSKKELELGLGKISDEHWKRVDDLESKRRAAERKYHTKFLKQIGQGSDIDFVPIPQKNVSEMYKQQDSFKKIGKKLRDGDWEIQDSKESGHSRDEFERNERSSNRINSIGEKR